MSPRPVGPDCRDEKCHACRGEAWDDAADETTACSCRCHEKGTNQ